MNIQFSVPWQNCQILRWSQREKRMKQTGKLAKFISTSDNNQQYWQKVESLTLDKFWLGSTKYKNIKHFEVMKKGKIFRLFFLEQKMVLY